VSLLACSGVFPRSFLVASNHVSYVQLCINNLFLLLYHWLLCNSRLLFSVAYGLTPQCFPV
jgi:hypothetical protein